MGETTKWTGTFWGAESGTAAAHLTREGSHVRGRFVLYEPGFGQSWVRLTGEWTESNKIVWNMDQFVSNSPVGTQLPQSGSVEATFDPSNGSIRGEWKTDLGNVGRFVLVRADDELQIPEPMPIQAAQPQQSSRVALAQPVQPQPALVTITKILGSYRLDERGIRSLAELIRDGTTVPVPAINAGIEGREFIHIGVDNLLADPSVPAILYDVRIAANEPVIQSGSKTVTVTLKRNDPNTLYVSGYDRVWVEGKAAQIEGFLKYHESKTANILRRYGSILNSVIFLLMLAFLPSVPSLRDRLEVVAYVFILLFSLLYSWRLATNTKVFLREPKFTWYRKNAGWLLVLLEVALSGWIGYLVQKYLRPH